MHSYALIEFGGGHAHPFPGETVPSEENERQTCGTRAAQRDTLRSFGYPHRILSGGQDLA